MTLILCLFADLCDEIPEEFSSTECTAIAGSIQVLLDEENRRLFSNDKEERVFQVVREILDDYAGTLSEDIELVAGVRYGQLSRQAFASSPLELDSSNNSPQKWKWGLPVFVIGAIIITVIAIMVLRDDRHRWRETTVNRGGIVGGDEASVFSTSYRDGSSIQFPLQAMELGQDDEDDQKIYDYEVIGSPNPFNASEEIAIQRKQLMKDYVMPFALWGLDDDNETNGYGEDACRKSRNVTL